MTLPSTSGLSTDDECLPRQWRAGPMGRLARIWRVQLSCTRQIRTAQGMTVPPLFRSADRDHWLQDMPRSTATSLNCFR